MLTPLSSNQWDSARAAHLLNRAGFGGTPAHVDSLVRSGMAASVRCLVDGPASPVPAPAPDWAQPTDYVAQREKARAAAMAIPPGDEAAKLAARREVNKVQVRQQFEQLLDLGWWWLDRMRQSADPLEEKMTLFWHGHFATSAQKVRDAYFMYRQNQTLREHARGNYGVLVKAMTRDPAMIDWLDLRESRRRSSRTKISPARSWNSSPSGEGHYTEKDVTEGARAFHRVSHRPAGQRASVFQYTGSTTTRPRQFLGRSNGLGRRPGHRRRFSQQPACAELSSPRKLWTFFAYENPAPALVAGGARRTRLRNASITSCGPLLRQMFASQEFYSPLAVMRTQIKSPDAMDGANRSRTLDIDLPPKAPAHERSLQAIGPDAVLRRRA